MVKVKRGMKSSSKHHATYDYTGHLALFAVEGVMLSHSTSSRLESGKHLVLLSAVARQCNIYRTIILDHVPDKAEAEARLRKWATKLPLADVK
jgi:hypothetical protein